MLINMFYLLVIERKGPNKMTTIYRTYSPEGDIDHATPSARDEWITENDEGVYRVVEQYYEGDVTWDADEFQASGKLIGAKDITAHVAEILHAVWCGDDTLMDVNPHELVYTYFDVEDERQEWIHETNEINSRPSYGGM